MNNVEKYFAGERLQCVIGMIISIACISLSVYFLFMQKPFLKGIAWPVIPLSVLLLVICTGVVIRTPKDITRVTAFLQAEPGRIKTEELPRMEKVMRSFSMIKKIELILLAAGLVIAVVFRKNDFVCGVGVGLTVLSAGLYLFDHLAEARGKEYLGVLKSLVS